MMSVPMTVTFLPLDGVRVIDVTSSLAGPYCTQILGALGADVVKVEHPRRGDESRAWGPEFAAGGSVLFFAANTGKRSLGLDLSTPRGREIVLRLAAGADVLIQSLRPGTAERLGIGPDDVRAASERLVYCSIGAFGREGPLAHLPGYDPLMQAYAGIMSVTGEEGRPHVRVGASVVDLGTATWAALAILAALLERERTGEGRVLDLSLYETALALMSYHVVDAVGTGAEPSRHGSAFPLIVPYQAFATADGELMVAAANDRLFAALCAALDLPQLAQDARFATNPLRVLHREELVHELAERFAAEPSGTWLARLHEAGVPVAPVQTTGEAARHEQTAALGILQELDGRQSLALPIAADGDRVPHRSPPPRLGEHTAEVLSEAGYSDEEVAELAADGVVSLGHGPAR
jgi:crotonobetainyl-CoA:carnitine CoA-transferase CaiB-like acyl-CoA transferase